MKYLIAILIGAALASAQTPVNPQNDIADQPITLQPGDYKWLPVIVRVTPTAVDCHFEVVSGKSTVHAELVTARDFVLFSHGREYENLATTPSLAAGGFRRMIETPGRYRVMIANDKGAPPATVALTIHVDVDPPPSSISTSLSTRRKISVILISLGIFSATVLWSGKKLLLAYKLKNS